MAQTRVAIQQPTALSIDVSAKIYALIQRFADFWAYRGTIRALSNLSTRELADLGMHRGEITRVALKSVYGR